MTRAYLTGREWDALLDAQNGTCCVAGCENAPTIGEHSTPQALRPGKPDQLMCFPCHKLKTFGLRGDLSNIAKAKRLAGDTLSQYEKRKRFGPAFTSRNSFQKRGE